MCSPSNAEGLTCGWEQRKCLSNPAYSEEPGLALLKFHIISQVHKNRQLRVYYIQKSLNLYAPDKINTDSGLCRRLIFKWISRSVIWFCNSVDYLSPARSPDSVVCWSHEGLPQGANLLQREMQSTDSETAGDWWVAKNKRNQNFCSSSHSAQCFVNGCILNSG